MKIYTYCAGKTLGHEEQFIQKLKGAKVVNSVEKCKVTIVFCPIVTRFETDIQSALTSVSDEKYKAVILVAMHHTLDKNYILPNHKDEYNRAVILFVHCLFHEREGLLRCPTNDEAIRLVREELGLYSCLPCGTRKITPGNSN